MKQALKNPLVIVNAVLVIFLAFLVLNTNAERLHLPRPVKQALAAVAAITGSGTSNKLAAFAAANQIGDSMIYDDGTHVGIGTTLPTDTLQVAGNVTFDGSISGPFDTNNVSRIQIGRGGRSSPDAGYIVFGDGTGWQFNFATARSDGATKLMTITDKGNVTISGTLNGHMADYAEWFEKEEDTKPGDLIGINTLSGKTRKYRSGDHFLGVHSLSPAVAAGRIYTTDQEMEKGHILVGVLGQLDFDRSQTIVEGRVVRTTDGVYVGILLSNGRVLIGR